MAHRIAIATANRRLTSTVVLTSSSSSSSSTSLLSQHPALLSKTLSTMTMNTTTYPVLTTTNNNNNNNNNSVGMAITHPSMTKINPKYNPFPSSTSSFHSTFSIEQESTATAPDDAVVSSSPTTATTTTVETTEMSPRVKEIFQKVLQLDFVEIHLLGELVYDKMGMSISDAMRQASVGGGSAAGASAKEETKEEVKTAFDLKLTGWDAKSKIKVIKEVRSITGLGLRDAKAMVEGFPNVVKKDIKMEEAEELKKKLESIGATVEIE
eukprot:CAMPEP_0197824414 /NCGR_PEP_ID=MMETSP1437-20131217/1664_1 /TAXON_ID=49252 ORGANISM="Eucampia antarctica, Strain CCMP1452" /NCGR_SAMPLE_ID=MMETSP1437 /ASSEMBLY_ACC=CAM_ASM_001096 /LENGTH=266 /DNA_ID=CAMNT_0043424033 /DNA_START=228 /DNA_END=1028 /DNA_ORIENTATION=+